MTDSENTRLDDYEITRIGWWVANNFLETIDIGQDGVTKIDAENQYLGEDCTICWIRVWKGNFLAYRYNARNIDTIEYAQYDDINGDINKDFDYENE